MPNQQQQVGQQHALHPEIEDAFRQVLGKSSRKTLRAIFNDPEVAGDLAKARRAFLRGFLYSLPTVSNKILDFHSLHVSPHLQNPKIYNVFLGNPSACATAAVLLWLHNPDRPQGGRKLAEAAVPHYLAFATTGAYKLRDPFRAFLKAEGPSDDARRHAQDSAFGALLLEAGDLLDNAERKKTAAGIATLLEALLVVREKREEETTLTLDIWLPLSSSWDLLLKHASADDPASTGLGKADLLARQELLQSLPSLSIESLIDELEDAGKWAGRGVCQLELRDKRVEEKGFFKVNQVWKTHDQAPLSQLYALSWPMPPDEAIPNFRIVLMGNTTITAQSQGDPLFEYLLGNWACINLHGKAQTIRDTLPDGLGQRPRIAETIFRIAKFAYQLAYHNHGATINLIIDTLPVEQEKMNRFMQRWDAADNETKLADGKIPLPSIGDPEELAKSFGRLVYTLTLQDGMSMWRLAPDGETFYLEDFGKYQPVTDDEINHNWPAHRDEMGLDLTAKIKGGRHRAAYVHSLFKNGKKSLVFCVSQDGYIEVFLDGLMLRLR